MNVITGLPRAGSTLLCNILNQNPRIYASSTSVMPLLLNALSGVLSDSPEIKGMMVRDEEKLSERLTGAPRAMFEAWYKDYQDKVVFDKARGWTYTTEILKNLYPDSKIVVLVRDLRSVFASLEKQHSREPMLDLLGLKTMYGRADHLFSDDGMIGSCILGIDDIMRRRPDGLIVVQYESLTQDPKLMMGQLYQKLGLEEYEHDFDNVVNVAEDVDGIYLNKYPHKGEGKVTPTDKDEWREYVSQDIADLIMEKFVNYNRLFGYA